MSRIVILGIDGATWNFISPLIENGSLPNFKYLLSKGSYGNLESTIPPLTPPAWTSAFTGVNPGKHNIFDFVYFDGYEKRITFSTQRRRDCLWNYASKYNKKSIIVNVPGTFPPEKINGIMVSGLGTPSVNSNFTYPQDIKKFLIDNNYVIEYGGVREWANNKIEFLNNVNVMTDKRKQIVSTLMKTYEWDIFATVFVSIDRLQHIFWRTDKNEDLVSEDYNVLLSSYKKMDDICGEIMNLIGKDDYVFIISDHGFGPISKGIYINNYLHKKGFLYTHKKSFLKETIINQSNLVKIAEKFEEYGLRKIINMIPGNIRSKAYNDTGVGLIDWDKTTAWFGTTSGHAIHINLKNRQPNGLVQQDEYDKVCDTIIKTLYKLKDNSVGKNVIKKCYRSNEIYSGPFLKNSPDIIIEPEKGYSLQDGFGDSIIGIPRDGTVRRYGDHEKDGIFLCIGPEIKEGMDLGTLNICDVYPTILHVLQMPLPNDLDGRVILDAFNESSYLVRNKITYQGKNVQSHILKQKINSLKHSNKI